MLKEIFSYVTGPEIVHRVALLSKRVREILQKKKDQTRGYTITLKVGPALLKPAVALNCESFYEDFDCVPVTERLGVNWHAYRQILKFANTVRLVCTDKNYSKVLSVIQVLHADA